MQQTYTGSFESRIYPKAFSSGTLTISLWPLEHAESYVARGCIVYTGAYPNNRNIHQFGQSGQSQVREADGRILNCLIAQ